MARSRRWWQRLQPSLTPKRLVFIDETWTKTNMTRSHGWWERGERLIAQVPHGHWQTMTFIAPLRHDGLTAPCVLDVPSTVRASQPMSSRSWCLRYRKATSSLWTISARTRATRSTQPSAPPEQGSCSCRPTHPTSTPIEQALAKLKTLLRKAEERTLEALWRRIGSLLDAFSSAECTNYFRNCGYVST